MDFGFRMKRNLETVCVLPVSQVLFVFPLHLPRFLQRQIIKDYKHMNCQLRVWKTRVSQMQIQLFQMYKKVGSNHFICFLF